MLHHLSDDLFKTTHIVSAVFSWIIWYICNPNPNPNAVEMGLRAVALSQFTVTIGIPLDHLTLRMLFTAGGVQWLKSGTIRQDGL